MAIAAAAEAANIEAATGNGNNGNNDQWETANDLSEHSAKNSSSYGGHHKPSNGAWEQPLQMNQQPQDFSALEKGRGGGGAGAFGGKESCSKESMNNGGGNDDCWTTPI